MGRNDIKRLVEKLCSMHLTVPWAVAHPFHIQRALNKGGVERAWLSLAFHSDLVNWKALALQTASRLTHLAKIVHWEPTHLGFCDTLGLGSRGVLIEPSRTGHNLVCRNPFPQTLSYIWSLQPTLKAKSLTPILISPPPFYRRPTSSRQSPRLA